MAAEFHDVTFPLALSFGATGGPERRTEVVTLGSGFEERNALWSQSRRRWDAGIGLRTLDDVQEVLAFFEARMGRLHAFRWRDWADWKSCVPSRAPAPDDVEIGVGDGNAMQFQLVKVYRSGPGVCVRPIRKPVAGTVRVAIDGIETSAEVDHATGAVLFGEAPPAGSRVTAGFAFDAPARFDADRIEVNLAAFDAGSIPSIPVIEVRTR